MPSFSAARILKPVAVVASQFKFTIICQVARARPLQFKLMKANMPYSILFHLLMPGRKVTDKHLQPCFLGKTLERYLPEANSTSIAPAAVRRDQQAFGVRIKRLGPFRHQCRRV